MGKTIAAISTSVDGYVTGPDDGPGQGLGIGGERLHHWVFGGPWNYQDERSLGEMSGADKEYFDRLTTNVGGGICGRGMYEGAGRWGGTNPFGGTLVVLTHRMEDAPAPESGFVFVDGLAAALARAREDAGEANVSIGGGADVIRQALAAGEVDELAISTAPVILGGGKRLFDGFTHDIDLEVEEVVSSPWATHTRYAVRH